MVELQIWEIWKKIQQIFRREIELSGVDRNMKECILEVKSRRTRVFINGMFTYHFVNRGGWGNLRKREANRKRGHRFWNGRLRHFHTFASVVEKNFMHKLSAFLWFFWWQKRIAFQICVDLHFCPFYYWNHLIHWAVQNQGKYTLRLLLTCLKVGDGVGGRDFEVGLLEGKWINWGGGFAWGN